MLKRDLMTGIITLLKPGRARRLTLAGIVLALLIFPLQVWAQTPDRSVQDAASWLTPESLMAFQREVAENAGTDIVMREQERLTELVDHVRQAEEAIKQCRPEHIQRIMAFIEQSRNATQFRRDFLVAMEVRGIRWRIALAEELVDQSTYIRSQIDKMEEDSTLKGQWKRLTDGRNVANGPGIGLPVGILQRFANIVKGDLSLDAHIRNSFAHLETLTERQDAIDASLITIHAMIEQYDILLRTQQSALANINQLFDPNACTRNTCDTVQAQFYKESVPPDPNRPPNVEPNTTMSGPKIQYNQQFPSPSPDPKRGWKPPMPDSGKTP